MEPVAATEGIGTDDRLVCAILAAQAGALRAGFESSTAVELLWRTVDALSALSGLVSALTPGKAAAGDPLIAQCAAATAIAAELSETLQATALRQSQTHDLGRQMAECIENALRRLAMPSASGQRISAAELAATYVSDTQRSVHARVVQN